MHDNDSLKKQYGLIGRGIGYSFSRKYFTEKFAALGLPNYSYDNFDVETIDGFKEVLAANTKLAGLNVTTPYKENIISYLDSVAKKAAKIGAVNTIRFTKKGKLKGYNTDWHGFKKSLLPMLEPHHKKALILGTGGASKAVAFALEKLGILYTFVSRDESNGATGYYRINATTFDNHQIIINCTPIGTTPNVHLAPQIPYSFFTAKHIAFDLIYNPNETAFLQNAGQHGAKTKNGYEMLVFQAEKAWKIWNK